MELPAFVLRDILADYSLYLGKEALVKESVKLLGVLGAGRIGGIIGENVPAVSDLRLLAASSVALLFPKTRERSSRRRELNRPDKRRRLVPE